MTLVEELLGGLAAAAGGARPISGRVTDAIGEAVVGATVRAAARGAFAGLELARATTDEAGRFDLRGAFPDELLLIVSAPGAEARQVVTGRGGEVGELRLVQPPRLTASVGDGGENRPRDVRRLQDRLLRLGWLSEADVAAEPVALDAAPPAPPGPRLMAALAAHLAAALGRPPPSIRVDPGGPLARSLSELPAFPPSPLALGAAVGELPGGEASTPRNAPADVAALQDRLRQLGLLRPADHLAEAVDAGAPGPIAAGALPRTMAAIASLEREMAGSSLRAILPGALGERLLRAPRCFGRPALRLRDSVGDGGRNRPDDVRAVQDRLLQLGHLAAADHAAERPAGATGQATPAPTRVPTAALPRTVAAIRALREARLGEPAAAVGLVEPLDPAQRWLERPARLELSDGVGWEGQGGAANQPADVAAVQARLLLLGLLSRQELDAEPVDPGEAAPVDGARCPRTAAALARLAGLPDLPPLAGPVGRGATNAVADVRAVQDRLLALGFLSAADHSVERVDPGDGGVADEAQLPATLQAIERLRGRLFELPAADPEAPWTAQALIEPGDETHRLLAAPLFAGRGPLRLAASVGAGGWNFPADVVALQDRLRALRLLSAAEHAAERVDPLRAARVPDEALPATCRAIARLRRTHLGEAAPVVARVEASSAELRALDDRLGALRAHLDLQGSVGWGGLNAPAEVLGVLDRLHGLGFLADEDHALEVAAARAAVAAGQARVPDAQLSQGIAAIADWQRLLLGVAAEPAVLPWSETLHTLEWPPLPRRVELALGGGVGRGAANAPADVRAVQDRLFELGLLTATGYFGERAEPTSAAAVPDAALGATIAAIEALQATLAGVPGLPPDGVVGAHGFARRILEDPTYSTPTAPNPSCAIGSAGPARPSLGDADLNRTAAAIEAVEGGRSSGEVPSGLRNCSGTPASWASAQVTGGTAILFLARGDQAAFAGHYRLDGSTLGALGRRAASAGAHFDRIGGAVPAGRTEAQLQSDVAAELAARGPQVRAETGLGPQDVERMFRAAQLRHHLLALGAAEDAAALFDRAAHPAAAANLAALGLTPADVAAYRAAPARHQEHRAGFVTRALFHAREGQDLRNALTDDSGRKVGRHVIERTWAATAGFSLDPRQRAQLTAYLHNHGGDAAALVAAWATVTSDPYVQRVSAVYDQLP